MVANRSALRSVPRCVHPTAPALLRHGSPSKFAPNSSQPLQTAGSGYAQNFKPRYPGFASRGFNSATAGLHVQSPDIPSGQIRIPHFEKILIANRGEIACRIIRTAKKLGIKTVAVYSEADEHALHVELADEAYCIGPAPSSESYLRIDKIIDVCRRSGAEGVHPGYGFLSENAGFAESLAREGLVFIGPPASAIISMGSKSESKNIMSAAGVPCVPGYHGDNQDPEYLYERAKEIGFPVLIKAVHGGGGKGMRIVPPSASLSTFKEALSSAQRESQKAFGNATVLVEKYIERPRHVEVQIFADMLGGVVSLWERDCSVQRRNQKIIEEAPAPGLSGELRADLSAKAIAAARAVNYIGAGTVEFIFDNDTQDFYFMEMNTRLQVEHPVTEMVTGLDLVEWQLTVARGNPLPMAQSAIPLVGHAFEARIYAENPRNNFLPDTGSLVYLSTPTPTHVFAPSLPPVVPAAVGSDLTPSHNTYMSIPPSIRLEQGFTQGSQIGVFYDPLIAKLVVHGRDRAEALRALRKALDEYKVVGVSTNVEFLRTLAGHESFINGKVETGFIPKYYDSLFPAPTEPSPEVFVQAALFVALSDPPALSPVHSSLSPWSSLVSRRFGGDTYERVISLQKDDTSAEPVTVHVKSISPGHFDITVHTSTSSKSFRTIPGRLVSPNTFSTTLGSELMQTTIISQSPPPNVPVSSAPSTMQRLHVFNAGVKTTLVLLPPKWLLPIGGADNASKAALKAPMPSLVVEVRVNVGDKVEKGQVIVVLESMKTETALKAVTDGTVKAISCKKGDMVEEGKELVDIEGTVH